MTKADLTVRPLHDGTNGVAVNPNMRIRDQARCPASTDAKHAVGEVHDHPGKYWGLEADISRAHRRYKHRRADWGLMACTLDDPDEVFLNCVGTFGIGCASYWWTRLFSIVGRTAGALSLDDFIFQLLYADDLHWLTSGREGIKGVVVCVYFMALVGTPFSWGKTAVGFQYEWIGYEVALELQELGASEDRAA